MRQISIPEIQRRLLDWYHQNKRDLPWRRTRDPYAIWVSEIMLQQTQVDTVIPYYQRWMKHFSSLQKLAQASIDDVLRHWEGLGYYSRARNLHRGAQTILQSLQGRIPTKAQELIKLPGIGPYTANAIASIAFNENVPVVDGNVRRVLSRIFLIKENPKQIDQKAGLILVHGKAGDFNQAMMELGALICTPRKPACPTCPVKQNCKAYSRGVQELYPAVKKRLIQRSVKTFAGLIWKEEKLLIRQRPLHGLLGGLWEFPTLANLPNKNAKKAVLQHLKDKIGIDVQIGEILGTYQQTYTHFKEHLTLYEGVWIQGKIPISLSSTWKWVFPARLNQFAFTGISGKIRKDLHHDVNRRQNSKNRNQKKSTL